MKTKQQIKNLETLTSKLNRKIVDNLEDINDLYDKQTEFEAEVTKRINGLEEQVKNITIKLDTILHIISKTTD
jgi:hypothetical protein